MNAALNAGLLAKAVRETAVPTALFALALAVFHTVLALILPQFFGDITALANNPFVANIIRGLLGTMGDQLGPEIALSMPWLHPIVLALVWTHEIAFCTRVPAAEVERGTIDVLMGLPASRGQVYLVESALWLGSGVVLMAAQLAGQQLGTALRPHAAAADAGRVVVVLCNQLALYAAVGGLAFLASALSRRRGRAMAVLFAILLASFFWQMLGQFWQPARDFAFVGLMHWYRPHQVLSAGGWPWRDMLVLVGAGGVLWCAGGVAFARRDL